MISIWKIYYSTNFKNTWMSIVINSYTSILFCKWCGYYMHMYNKSTGKGLKYPWSIWNNSGLPSVCIWYQKYSFRLFFGPQNALQTNGCPPKPFIADMTVQHGKKGQNFPQTIKNSSILPSTCFWCQKYPSLLVSVHLMESFSFGGFNRIIFLCLC